MISAVKYSCFMEIMQSIILLNYLRHVIERKKTKIHIHIDVMPRIPVSDCAGGHRSRRRYNYVEIEGDELKTN